MGRAASAGPGWAGPWRGLGGPSRALGGGFPAPGRGPGLRPALAQGLLSTNRSPGTPRITSAQLLSPCCRRARLSSLSLAPSKLASGALPFSARPCGAWPSRRWLQEPAGGCRGGSSLAAAGAAHPLGHTLDGPSRVQVPCASLERGEAPCAPAEAQARGGAGPGRHRDGAAQGREPGRGSGRRIGAPAPRMGRNLGDR